MTFHPDESPIDLTPLADAVPADGDRFTASVMARVAAVARTPASRIDPLWGLWSMRRGLAFTGAALVVLLLATRERDGGTPEAPATIAESIGVPPEFRSMIVNDHDEGGGR